ncbi:MAG: transketolase [Candidatus Omnitrophica bacterium]|nr:transketolase [Candidatus Omnitrophota bacterium]
MARVKNYRRDIGNALLPYFRKDPRYYLLVCDMGFGVIDKLRAEYPKRIINCGVMEQGTIGIAAGMSMSGLIPLVYSIVNFLVFRSLEQMRNDVVLQKLNVKFIATGVNNYFKLLGPSHCCGKDDIALMKLINLDIYDPYSDKRSFTKLVDDWLVSDRAGYMRV